VPYKQVFAHLYTAGIADLNPIGEAMSILPDGDLKVNLGSRLLPEIVALGVPNVALSRLVMANEGNQQTVASPDGRYQVEVDTFVHEGITEYWLIHIDKANGKFKRAKLASDYRSPAQGPRVAISPRGSYFMVDDSGTIRIYSTPHLVEAGVFQIAHASTENRIVALAVSADERMIVGLSCWKDIVLYSVTERKVVFVRQIRDGSGWYDARYCSIMLLGNTQAIATIGSSSNPGSVNSLQVSVNAFKFIPLPVTVGQS
jgi:hypothetical protein